ncbi:MAG TPA: exopolysaccharide biosynthesis polyprenyl glycosylphosphotransferase [Solirubrobacteraceae bacterium]|nr:exopolysaccharide biosynthesis polyprenyl glycosylphosphotransferase [Solirubrobacteraceae bacterium]
MTPDVASHAERSRLIGVGRPPSGYTATAVARLLDGRVWSQMRLLVDAMMLCLASTAAFYAAPIRPGAGAGWLAAIFPALTLLILRARNDPDERLHTSPLDTAAHVLGVTSLSAMLMVAAGSILGGDHPVALAVRLWLFALVYLSLARIMLSSIRAQAVRNVALATPTLIVGAGVIGEHLVKRFTADSGYGLRPVGFLDSDPMPKADWTAGATVPVLGGPEDLEAAITRTGARRVILAFSSEPDRALVDKVRECEQLGVGVSIVPRMFEAINERAILDHVGGIPLISLRPTNPRGWQFAVKHTIDRTLAFLALVALAPVMAAVAAGVRLSSPGPILFRQRRVGRDGRVFDVLKFRTMREANAEGEYAFVPPEGCAPGGIEGEDRRTRFGSWLRKSSLDEAPQLINVLRGEMSIVGPRPERPQFAAQFGAEVDRYDDRLRVKSGITGWAQVNGLRGQTSIADRVEWDNYYIRNWSLALDLKIMMLTVAEVLRFRDSQKARKYGGGPAGVPRHR